MKKLWINCENQLYKQLLDKITVDLWQRGGMVTQRIANPCIPVRFRALPPQYIFVEII